MTTPVVVIGIGNAYRRDDGVGLAVADDIAKRALPGIGVQSGIREPSALLDVWAGAELAIVVDATVTPIGEPGRIRRLTCDAVVSATTTSSHGLDVSQALELGKALHRNPFRVVMYAVDVVDTGYGVGLTPEVAASVPGIAAAIVAEAEAATGGDRLGETALRHSPHPRPLSGNAGVVHASADPAQHPAGHQRGDG